MKNAVNRVIIRLPKIPVCIEANGKCRVALRFSPVFLWTRTFAKRFTLLAASFMAVSCLDYSLTVKMEATCSTETSVYCFKRTMWYYIPQDRALHNHCCSGNLEMRFLIPQIMSFIGLYYLRREDHGVSWRQPLLKYVTHWTIWVPELKAEKGLTRSPNLEVVTLQLFCGFVGWLQVVTSANKVVPNAAKTSYHAPFKVHTSSSELRKFRCPTIAF
jgi:hypothetical protein